MYGINPKENDCELTKNIWFEHKKDEEQFCVNYKCLQALINELKNHLTWPESPEFNRYGIPTGRRWGARYYVATDLRNIRECVTEILNNMKSPVELEDSKEYGPGSKTMFKRFKRKYLKQEKSYD